MVRGIAFVSFVFANATIRFMSLPEKLITLGITLPPLAGPFGAYVPAKRVGTLVYVAGQLPMKDGKSLAIGQVPSRCSIEQAKTASRQCVINGLAAAATVVPLDQLTGVLRVGAFVSSDTSFTAQPQIANGASEFLLELFGDAGKHVRAAVGVNTLPLDASVEIEFIFTIGDK
jgi:enamine deaminase RidA (YjgF/YER057c/UK114 family)